ncbi:MAG: reverse transcriptase domain-containing protein [Candidatus Korobacteraceae bacterium]|jgi:RNA-directed DNA polymerase
MIHSASARQTISDREFLRKAWREISKRNMLSRGVDNVTIKAFKSRLDENLAEISVDLRAGKYVFNKLRAHANKKPGSKKERPLQIATVRDRVVMKAIALFIEPAFQEFNLECSFAFIKGRGVTPAINRIRELLAQGNKFYFEADIINFFGEVDKQVLWEMFSKRVRQRSLLPLLRQCFNLELENLQSYETEFQELFLGADSGIPQGGVLSPMLANFYLYEFDRRMLRYGFNLVRYADDFVVMCESADRAGQAHSLSRDTLGTLNLRIHELNTPDSKSRIGNFSKDGLMFLGVRFEGQEIFPASKAVKRLKAKVEEVVKPNSGISLFKTLQKLTNLINGWGKHYKSMRVLDMYRELDEFIKVAVESYLESLGVRLVGRNKRKHMRLLGIPSLRAMIEFKKRSSPAVTSVPEAPSQQKTMSAGRLGAPS